MFENLKAKKRINKITAECLEKELQEKAASHESNAKEVYELWEKRQTVRMNGITTGDLVKILANVAVVGAIMVFETSHVMNKNAMKFVQPIKFGK